jgi:hypothetical protein
MSVKISSINHVEVRIGDERDFKILERFSNKAKRVEVIFSCKIEEVF